MNLLSTDDFAKVAGGCNTCGAMALVTVYTPSTLLDIQIPVNSSLLVTDVCTNYQISTPVYDPFGYYVGDIVDSYQTCTPVLFN